MSDGRKAIKPAAKIEIEYPPEVLAKLEGLPLLRNGPLPYDWKPWQDDLIMKEWYRREKQDIADLCGVGKTSVKARHKALMRRIHETNTNA